MASLELNQTTSYDDSVASDASSILLRERRARQIKQENLLRSRMERIATTAESMEGISQSSKSFDDESLISFSMSRHSNGVDTDLKGLKWEKVAVEFSFCLLTAQDEAPSLGEFNNKKSSDGSSSTQSSSQKLLGKTPILKHIMKKMGDVSKSAVQHRSGNVMIKARSPYVSSVVRDESYQPSVGRNATVRSYIKAVIPINVSNVNVQELTRSSQIMSKILIKQALIEGVQRKIFEPHFEEH